MTNLKLSTTLKPGGVAPETTPMGCVESLPTAQLFSSATSPAEPEPTPAIPPASTTANMDAMAPPLFILTSVTQFVVTSSMTLTKKAGTTVANTSRYYTNNAS